jgi:flavodoxin I
MKTLIVYDSLYGNTEQIARAIANGLGAAKDVRLLKAGEASFTDVTGIDILIVGSPTQGTKATVAVQEFLKKLPENSLKGVKTAAFDTRMTNRLIRMLGYAAPKIARSLEGSGATMAVQSEGFWVTGGKGPLKEGELERAAEWGRRKAAASTDSPGAEPKTG